MNFLMSHVDQQYRSYVDFCSIDTQLISFSQILDRSE